MKFNLHHSNQSKYDFDVLWFVAQDIEHLKTLHSKTNSKVKINDIIKDEKNSNLYKKIKYTTWRKVLNFIPIRVETKREIINDKIIYTEEHKYLKTTIKNCHSINKLENYYLLEDKIEIDTPFPIYLFKSILKFLIKRHLNSQFVEDEIFRERLQDIKNKFGSLKKYVWLDIN